MGKYGKVWESMGTYSRYKYGMDELSSRSIQVFTRSTYNTFTGTTGFVEAAYAYMYQAGIDGPRLVILHIGQLSRASPGIQSSCVWFGVVCGGV